MKKKILLILKVIRYTEIYFLVGYPTLLQDFFVMQHISVNPLISCYLGFNFAQFVTFASSLTLINPRVFSVPLNNVTN